MTSREKLYATAVSMHQSEARKFGALSLMFGSISIPLGISDSLAGNWLSFFLLLAAFFFFSRYAGESRPLESLKNRLDMQPPTPPFPPISFEVEKLVQEYGKVLERFAGESLARISVLPAPKSRLKRALATAIQHSSDPAETMLLQQGYLALSHFQPIPEGCGDLALAASFEELADLQKELNMFVPNCLVAKS